MEGTGELAPPVLAPGLLRGHELLELDRTVLLPDAPGAPEVRDTRFGVDPCLGEYHRSAAGSGHFPQFLHLGAILG